jgi:hypothetical protein
MLGSNQRSSRLVGVVETADGGGTIAVRVFDLGWTVGLALVPDDGREPILAPLLLEEEGAVAELLDRVSGEQRRPAA